MLDPQLVAAIDCAIRRAEIVLAMVDVLNCTRAEGIEAARLATEFDQRGDVWAARIVEIGTCPESG